MQDHAFSGRQNALDRAFGVVCGGVIAGRFGAFSHPFGNRRIPVAMHRDHRP
jgi:hypothetical protein